MECKQPVHFQRNCPVRRRRLANPDLDLPEVSESVVSVPGMPESASAGAATVAVDSAPAAFRLRSLMVPALRRRGMPPPRLLVSRFWLVFPLPVI